MNILNKHPKQIIYEPFANNIELAFHLDQDKTKILIGLKAFDNLFPGIMVKNKFYFGFRRSNQFLPGIFINNYFVPGVFVKNSFVPGIADHGCFHPGIINMGIFTPGLVHRNNFIPGVLCDGGFVIGCYTTNGQFVPGRFLNGQFESGVIKQGAFLPLNYEEFQFEDIVDTIKAGYGIPRFSLYEAVGGIPICGMIYGEFDDHYFNFPPGLVTNHGVILGGVKIDISVIYTSDTKERLKQIGITFPGSGNPVEGGYFDEFLDEYNKSHDSAEGILGDGFSNPFGQYFGKNTGRIFTALGQGYSGDSFFQRGPKSSKSKGRPIIGYYGDSGASSADNVVSTGICSVLGKVATAATGSSTAGSLVEKSCRIIAEHVNDPPVDMGNPGQGHEGSSGESSPEQDKVYDSVDDGINDVCEDQANSSSSRVDELGGGSNDILLQVSKWQSAIRKQSELSQKTSAFNKPIIAISKTEPGLIVVDWEALRDVLVHSDPAANATFIFINPLTGCTQYYYGTGTDPYAALRKGVLKIIYDPIVNPTKF